MTYTTTEAAAALGVSPALVRRLAARHAIGTQLGNRLRLFTAEDLAVLAARNRRRGRPSQGETNA